MKIEGRRLKAEDKSRKRSRWITPLSPLTCLLVLLLASKVEGGRKLTEFLKAPQPVQDAFDRKVAAAIKRSLEAERAVANEVGDDPLWTQPPADPVDATWDESWSRRAKFKPKKGQPAPYDRHTDPLFALDLRDVWDELTGGEIRNGRAHCPSPQHDDQFPDCGVRESDWRCFACGANGSIIDLGAHLYGMEPRGKAFFDIRERLLSQLGIEERRAA